MSVTGRKLTIRMPDTRKLRGAEVVAVHIDPGGAVREGTPVVTVTGPSGDQVIRAPRRGRAVPLVSAGDGVIAGDPLFILNVDETALNVAKAGQRRSMLGLGADQVAQARHGDAAGSDLRPRDLPKDDVPDYGEDLLYAWLKPALAIAIYVMACFLLLPVFSSLGGKASQTEIFFMVAIAVTVAFLMAIFLMPASGRWPRWTVRLVAISWLILSTGVLFTRVMFPTDFVIAETDATGDGPVLRSALDELPFGDGTGDRTGDANSAATGDAASLAKIDDGAASGAGKGGTGLPPGQAPDAPRTVLASGVHAGQTDLIPFPQTVTPGAIPPRSDRVTAHNVGVRSWDRALPARTPGDPLPAVTPGDVPKPGAIENSTAAAKVPGALGQFAPLPRNLPDPAAKTLLSLAAVSRTAPDVASRAAAILTDPVDEPALALDLAESAAAATLLADLPKTATAGTGAVPVAAASAPQTTPGDVARPAPAPILIALSDRSVDEVAAVSDASKRLASTARTAAPGLDAGGEIEPHVPGRLRAPATLLATTAQDTGAPDTAAAVLADAGSTPLSAASPIAVTASAHPGRPAASSSVTAPGLLAVLHGEMRVAVADQGWTVPQAGVAPTVAAVGPELDFGSSPDPVALQDRTTGGNRWMQAQIAMLGAGTGNGSVSGSIADGATGAAGAPAILAFRQAISDPIADTPEARADAVPDPSAAPSPRSPDAPFAVAAISTDGTPVTAALAAPPTADRHNGARPRANLLDPVMLAALRAGEPAWMHAQASRAGREDIRAKTDPMNDALPHDDLPNGDRLIALTRPTTADGAATGRTPVASTRQQLSVLPLLRGQPEPVLTDASAPANGGALRVPDTAATTLAALDSSDRAALSDLPQAPPHGTGPATRMLLYLFFDDPRLQERPRLGDSWAADLPPEIAQAIWSNRVVAVHEIIQVDNWCGGDGDDAERAWLSDRIRLLQVRVDIDADAVSALEAALPVFGDAPPGFFHNRLPLMGGAADAKIMDRARGYLRQLPGGAFFDDAAQLTRAMQKAGCTQAVWNNGDGPANSLGARLADKFGS